MWLYTPSLGLLDTRADQDRDHAAELARQPESLAMWSLAITTVWWTLGFNFVLYLAGLQEIPRELYEAAAIDGAGPWQQIRTITIPMLGRTTTLVAVLQVIASLKVFDQMYLMTSGGPNFAPARSLEYIYDEGFTELPRRLRLGRCRRCSSSSCWPCRRCGSRIVRRQEQEV